MHQYNPLWSPETWKHTVRKAIMITNFKMEIAEILDSTLKPVFEMEYSILVEELEKDVFEPDNFYLVHIVEEYNSWLKNDYDISMLLS